MKTILITLIITFSITSYLKAGLLDSLVIHFANRTKLVLYAPDKKGIQSLSAYDLNKIVREMGMKLDSIPNGRTYIINEINGLRYLRDTMSIVIKSGNNVRITVSANDTTRHDSSTSSKYNRLKNRVNHSDLNIKTDFYIGLNNWIAKGPVSNYASNLYELRPLGSRYFAISLYRHPTLWKNSVMRVSIRYGLELAWNNYMFEENVRVQKGINAVEFAPITELLKKSKLTVTTIQLPIVPQFSFYNSDGRKTFHIGIGGFVGYRIDSYTKIKYQNNDKYHDHSNYYLNDLQYGLMTNIGLFQTDLFVKYNLNTVFKTNQGPDLHTISFGISL